MEHAPGKKLKPGQNKKGQKNFQLHRFLNTFIQLAAEKKYSKNGAAGKFFSPSYFVTALAISYSIFQMFSHAQKLKISNSHEPEFLLDYRIPESRSLALSDWHNPRFAEADSLQDSTTAARPFRKFYTFAMTL